MANEKANRYFALAQKYRQQNPPRLELAAALERQAQREYERGPEDINDIAREQANQEINSTANYGGVNNAPAVQPTVQQAVQQAAQQPVRQPVQQAEQYQQPNAFGGVEQALAQPVVASAEPQIQTDVPTQPEKPSTTTVAPTQNSPAYNLQQTGNDVISTWNPSETRYPFQSELNGNDTYDKSIGFDRPLASQYKDGGYGAGGGSSFSTNPKAGYLNSPEDYMALLKLLENY